MGETISIFGEFQYYNTTWVSDAGQISLFGFGAGSNSDVTFENLTWGVDAYASLAFSETTFHKLGDAENLYAGGFGGLADIYFDFGDKYNPQIYWGYLQFGSYASFGAIDSELYVNHSNSHPGIEVYGSAPFALQNFVLSGNPIYYDSNATSETDVYVEASSLFAAYQSEWSVDGWTRYAEFELSGAYDALDATIECSNGTACEISCYSAHACYGLTVNCDDTADCFVDCNQTAGIWCPLGENYIIGCMFMYRFVLFCF